MVHGLFSTLLLLHSSGGIMVSACQCYVTIAMSYVNVAHCYGDVVSCADAPAVSKMDQIVPMALENGVTEGHGESAFCCLSFCVLKGLALYDPKQHLCWRY